MRRTAKFLMLVGVLAAALAACVQPPKKQVFAAYQAHMQSRGYLRTEPNPADAPYSNTELAENFRRIAFYTYPNDARHLPKPLTRWEGPLRYSILGNEEDRAAVATLMKHLADLTNLDIATTRQEDANFLIMILDEAEGRAATQAFEDRESREFFDGFLSAIFDCGAIAAWSEESPTIDKALIYLHGDLRGLYRKLCFHEEIAQSLGLFNDDPYVRPSIFNDDDEFALLTTHDEYLLRILYDRRLKPGMTPAEAMPLVSAIIEELRPGR